MVESTKRVHSSQEKLTFWFVGCFALYAACWLRLVAAPYTAATGYALTAILLALSASLVAIVWVLLRRGYVKSTRSRLMLSLEISALFVAQICYELDFFFETFGGGAWLGPYFVFVTMIFVGLGAHSVLIVLCTEGAPGSGREK